jgi:hypothetical protein
MSDSQEEGFGKKLNLCKHQWILVKDIDSYGYESLIQKCSLCNKVERRIMDQAANRRKKERLGYIKGILERDEERKKKELSEETREELK